MAIALYIVDFFFVVVVNHDYATASSSTQNSYEFGVHTHQTRTLKKNTSYYITGTGSPTSANEPR